jgi:hypothetical protein
MQKLILLVAFICTQYSFASILPENNRAIPVTDKTDGLSELQYNQVIDKVEAVYRPMIEKLGKKLTIQRLWEDPRVNAGTTIKGNEIILRMYGGYARHPLITEDAYALVMCHEFGHHFGGVPKKLDQELNGIWASVEGQADYYATLKCLRKVFRRDNNIEIVSKLKGPKDAQDKCAATFDTEWEIALCIRTILAGMVNSSISADIRHTEVPTIETPDPSIVELTVETHPVPQCRLDTYFNGAVCEVSSYLPLSNTNEVTGTCHPKTGHDSGTRPLCWYNPK